VEQVSTVATEWQPHLLILDMALNGLRVMQILGALWGTDHRAESNVVDQHVRYLRALLRTDGRQPRFIATVAGHGYRFLPSGQTG
jgi:two-component system phosphate regulon response regulator OmpR